MQTDRSTTRAQEMYAMYEQGATMRQVAEEFGLSPTHVSRLFKKAGLKTRPSSPAVDDATVRDMCALYEQGAMLGEVADDFGLPRNRVSRLFKEAGLKTRPSRSPAVDPSVVQEMHELYEQGATINEVADEFGLSRERVRQLFREARLPTRSRAEAGAVKRELGRERAEEILESFRRLKDPQLVASELEIPKNQVIKVVREELPVTEYRHITHAYSGVKKKYSDGELIAFLREASAAVEATPLTAHDYDAYASSRRTRDGRAWPTEQTPSLRFGSWRAALIAAGLHANPSSARAGRRRFDEHGCIQAIRRVREMVGKTPTCDEYERCARESGGSMPSVATVRHRCGNWNQALQKAGL